MPDDYIPIPREYSTLVSNGFDTYLIGGNCTKTIREISYAKIESDTVIWKKVDW